MDYHQYARWHAKPTVEQGILIASDAKLEWMIPWWWMNYSRYNAYPITFIDFGMTDRLKQLCRQLGEVIPFEVPFDFIQGKEAIDPDLAKKWESIYLTQEFWNTRVSWFKKPFAMLHSPYRQTIWLDVDCQVCASLEEMFKTCQNQAGLAVAPEPDFSTQNFIKRGLIKSGEKWYNGGVVVFQHGSSVISDWARLIIEQNNRSPGDSGLLGDLIRLHRLDICELPPIYNWRMTQGLNPDAVIIHWVADWGKAYIKESVRQLLEFDSNL